MNIQLTPETEAVVAQAMQFGHFDDANEAVREGMRLLLEQSPEYRRKLEDLRRDLDVGIRQLDAGQGMPFDDVAVDEIIREGRARLQQRNGTPTP